MRHILATAVLITASLGVAAAADEPKLTFGEKDKGKPHSAKAGQVVASGKVELPKDYAHPQVNVLIRPKGEQGFVSHKATLNKDDTWTFEGTGFQPGTYEVRIELRSQNTKTEKRIDVYVPDLTAKPNTIEVVVK